MYLTLGKLVALFAAHKIEALEEKYHKGLKLAEIASAVAVYAELLGAIHGGIGIIVHPVAAAGTLLAVAANVLEELA